MKTFLAVSGGLTKEQNKTTNRQKHPSNIRRRVCVDVGFHNIISQKNTHGTLFLHGLGQNPEDDKQQRSTRHIAV